MAQQFPKRQLPGSMMTGETKANYLLTNPTERERLKQILNNELTNPFVKEQIKGDCPICAEKLNYEVCLTTCNHAFHCKCINWWLNPNKEPPTETCPVCRTANDTSDLRTVFVMPGDDLGFGKRKQRATLHRVNSEIKFLRASLTK